jgi:hypothetical protein
MSRQTTTQSDISAGGDIAGGNITKNVIEAPRTPMSHLLQRLRNEVRADSDFKQTIQHLQHFLDQSQTAKILGVEEKLKRAGRQDEIEEALLGKERFAKRLQAHMFSPVAQEIFACILGKLEVSFKTKIKPLVLAGKSRIDIDSILLDNVINPCFDGLETNDLQLYLPDLRDMLYFLTGNCHINWHCD